MFSAVAQGSVQGPLSFNMFAAQLAQKSTCRFSAFVYADDSKCLWKFCGCFVMVAEDPVELFGKTGRKWQTFTTSLGPLS